jgi:uncharacterized membrane protein
MKAIPLAGRLSWRSPGAFLLVVGSAHFLLLLAMGLTRHWSYLTSVLDLGVYDQSLWGILNGAPFINTGNELDQATNRLGVQFNPVLAVFAPLYAVLPAAEWLILIQALAISITAWPLYLVGVRVLSSERAALLWAIAYLFNPFVLSAAAWDFHAIALAAPLMALAMLAVQEKRVKILLFSCLALLLVREHFGIAVAGFGILWWLRQRTPAPGLLALGMGGLSLFLVLGWIMPALSPVGGHVMISQDLGALSRYGWLGTSLREVLHSLIFNPIDTLTLVFWDMGGWLYVTLLLLPLAAIPLVGMEFLLPAGADLAANLFSANPMPRSVFAYHSISLIPLLVVGGMHGARRLSRWERYSGVGLGRLVVLASLLLGYWFSPLPLPGSANVWEPAEFRMWPERSVSEIRRLLPPSVSVAAQSNIASHFTQRRSMRVFPNGLGEVDCVVLRLASPTRRIAGEDPGEVGSLAHHLQMNPSDFLASVRDVVAAEEYGLRYWNPPWLVVCEGSRTVDLDKEGVYAELDNVAEIWMRQPSS